MTKEEIEIEFQTFWGVVEEEAEDFTKEDFWRPLTNIARQSYTVAAQKREARIHELEEAIEKHQGETVKFQSQYHPFDYALGIDRSVKPWDEELYSHVKKK